MKNKKIKMTVALLILLMVGVPSSVYGYSYYSYQTDLNHAEMLLSDERYDDSVSAFLSLKSNKFSNHESAFIDSKVKLASELKQSKEAFDAAMKLFNEKKYINAIDSFKNVQVLDKKRYVQAQEKIKEASNLYVTGNITIAKTEAGNKKYDNAISFLDNVLKFDKNNKEAINLKDTYNKEIQRIKDEENKKQAAPQISPKQPINTSNSSSSNPTNSTGYTITSYDGWFATQGIQAPNGFGIKVMMYGAQPFGIYYSFVGEYAQYIITFHLPTGDVKKSGTTSNDLILVPALPVDVPRYQTIKYDISAIYKGKTYTGSFTKVINSKI